MWFFRSPEIAFGEFALDQLDNIQGDRALIVTDQNIVALGFVERVKAKLSTTGIQVAVFAEVEADPSLEVVRRGAEAALAYQPDWIIGLGGGSCLDAAKAAWFLYERPDMDPAEISPLATFGLRAKARLIAIPTTSGTGAEATMAAVLTDSEEGRKLACGSPELLPDLAIVDPEFVLDLPAPITADTGMDVLAHAVEGYTSTCSNDFSDGLCLKAIQLVFNYLPRAYSRGGSDPEAREKMHNAATIAGLGFGNAMAALAHAMGHALGATFHTPHGRAVGLLLPYTIEFNANNGQGRYADIARLLGLPAVHEAQGAANLVAAIQTLQHKIGQPVTISDLNISHRSFMEALPRLVANTDMDTQVVFGARIPDSKQTEKLFLYAYDGRPVDF
jgi:alcohol dehydrogenase class IV